MKEQNFILTPMIALDETVGSLRLLTAYLEQIEAVPKPIHADQRRIHIRRIGQASGKVHFHLDLMKIITKYLFGRYAPDDDLRELKIRIMRQEAYALSKDIQMLTNIWRKQGIEDDFEKEFVAGRGLRILETTSENLREEINDLVNNPPEDHFGSDIEGETDPASKSYPGIFTIT
jgi:hypothetical protein